MEKEERIEHILQLLNTEIKSIENIELEDDIPIGPELWLKVHKLKKAYKIIEEYKYK
jgi:hypothetical protein